jgi:adenylate cyclase
MSGHESAEPPAPASVPAASTVYRAVLVVDLVESVRLMLGDEASVIARWRRFSEQVRHQLLPSGCGGRVVKSLGDGLLMDFTDARSAAGVALQLHEQIECVNEGCSAATRMALRVGANFAPLVVDDFDVYGVGVNLAARLATLAEPGQTVAAEAFCAELALGVDAEADDLGEHYLKHIEAPVRAFSLRRCGPVTGTPWQWAGTAAEPAALPTLAVLPFATRGGGPEWRAAGEMLAEDLTAALSRSSAWRVTSRLSSASFTGRSQPLADVAQRLGVRYVVSGTVTMLGAAVRVYAEVCDTRDGQLLWARTLGGSAADLVAGDGDLLPQMLQAVGRALIDREIALTHGRPLSALHERSLLLQAVTGMHRMSRAESTRAMAALEHVVARHPRHASGYAWQAKWHLIQLAQAWSDDPAADAARWHVATHKALERDPSNALSLALEGYACAFVERDLDSAQEHLLQAQQSDPNEALAWLFQSAVHAHLGDGAAALAAMARADAMSPLDPMRYFFDAFGAIAALAAEDYALACRLGRKSVKLNAQHLPSWVGLAIAAAHAGLLDEARSAGRHILALRPQASVARFSAHHPARSAQRVHKDADALRAAGIPE